MAESLQWWQKLLPIIITWWVLHQLLQWGRTPPGRTGRCRHRSATAQRLPPLPGLIEKPHCEACAREAMLCPPPPPSPPPMMDSNRACPRRFDTSAHFCPHKSCRYYGWLARGNIRANDHPTGRGWRQLYCAACGRYFLETHGTLFYRKTRTAEDILRAIAALAEGLGIYNLCLPHAGLRLALLPGTPASRSRVARRWQGATSAMAAGLTDHVWHLREFLLLRVPPWPQPALE